MSTIESALNRISLMWNPIVEVTNLLENDNLRLLFEDERERTKREVVSLILVILSVNMILLSTGVILDFPMRNAGEESIVPVGHSAIFTLMILVYDGLSSPDVFTKDKTVQRISRKATPYLCFSLCFTIMITIIPGDRFTMLPVMGILALLSPIMPSTIIVRGLNKRQARVWLEAKHKSRYHHYTRKGEYCYCGAEATTNQNGSILRLFLWSDFVSRKYELHIENKTEVKERITATLSEIKRGVEEGNSEVYANQNQTGEIKKLISQLEGGNANKSICVKMADKLDSFNGILDHIVEQPVQAQEQTNQQQEIINKLEELMRLVEALNNEIQEQDTNVEYIHRRIEDMVRRAAQSFKVMLITDVRQTGKSALLQRLFPKRKQLLFGGLFLGERAKEDPEVFMILYEPPAILNEVQRVPDLFRYLKLHCNGNEAKGQFLLSSSQPFSLMWLAFEPLAGRVTVLELSTLPFRELTGDSFSAPFVPGLDYLRERQKTVVKPKNIWGYIHRGGYPGMQDATVDWQMYFSGYVETYLERDMHKLSATRDLDAFRKFMIACAARTGEILNYNNIAGEIGKDVGTVKRWLSTLKASGIICLLESYTASMLKHAIKTPKLYFRDTDLAAHLTKRLTVGTLASSTTSGAFFETFMISKILKSYANHGLNYRYFIPHYHRRDLKSTIESEIDFTIEESGILYPVEIKQSSRPEADVTATFQLLDIIPEKKRGIGAAVCLRPEPGVLRENVLALSVWYT